MLRKSVVLVQMKARNKACCGGALVLLAVESKRSSVWDGGARILPVLARVSQYREELARVCIFTYDVSTCSWSRRIASVRIYVISVSRARTCTVCEQSTLPALKIKVRSVPLSSPSIPLNKGYDSRIWNASYMKVCLKLCITICFLKTLTFLTFLELKLLAISGGREEKTIQVHVQNLLE